MKKIFLFVLLAASFTSCQVNRRSMRESNYQIWLNKSDISYTEHVLGEADQTKLFGIDFKRLLGGQYDLGGVNNLPLDPIGGSAGSSISNSSVTTSGETSVFSTVTSIVGLGGNISRVEQFAIHDLIQKNPGYDLIMFPQFEVQRKWFLIGSKTHVVVKARMAKITPDKQ